MHLPGTAIAGLLPSPAAPSRLRVEPHLSVSPILLLKLVGKRHHSEGLHRRDQSLPRVNNSGGPLNDVDYLAFTSRQFDHQDEVVQRHGGSADVQAEERDNETDWNALFELKGETHALSTVSLMANHPHMEIKYFYIGIGTYAERGDIRLGTADTR